MPPGRVSAAAENFIRRCLQKDPRSRPSTEELLRHPWTQVHQARHCRRFQSALPARQWQMYFHLPSLCLLCCSRAQRAAELTDWTRMLRHHRTAAAQAWRHLSCPPMLPVASPSRAGFLCKPVAHGLCSLLRNRYWLHSASAVTQPLPVHIFSPSCCRHKAARASKSAVGAPASKEGRPARMSSATRKTQPWSFTAPASAFGDC